VCARVPAPHHPRVQLHLRYLDDLRLAEPFLEMHRKHEENLVSSRRALRDLQQRHRQRCVGPVAHARVAADDDRAGAGSAAWCGYGSCRVTNKDGGGELALHLCDAVNWRAASQALRAAGGGLAGTVTALHRNGTVDFELSQPAVTAAAPAAAAAAATTTGRAKLAAVVLHGWFAPAATQGTAPQGGAWHGSDVDMSSGGTHPVAVGEVLELVGLSVAPRPAPSPLPVLGDAEGGKEMVSSSPPPSPPPTAAALSALALPARLPKTDSNASLASLVSSGGRSDAASDKDDDAPLVAPGSSDTRSRALKRRERNRAAAAASSPACRLFATSEGPEAALRDASPAALGGGGSGNKAELIWNVDLESVSLHMPRNHPKPHPLSDFLPHTHHIPTPHISSPFSFIAHTSRITLAMTLAPFCPGLWRGFHRAA